LAAARNYASPVGLVDRVVRRSGEQIRDADDVRGFQTPDQYLTNIIQFLNYSNPSKRVNLRSGARLTVSQATRFFPSAARVEASESQFEHGTSENPFVVADPSLFQNEARIFPGALNLVTYWS